MVQQEASSRGRFFVIDGVDGCGKSTQARRLCEAFEEGGRTAPLHLREPGSTPVGERLRALLLDSKAELGPEVETLLFAAARRQLLEECVEPALAAGRDVVCERFHGSTFAYQAFAGDVAEEDVLGLLAGWANDPAPDLVVLLDVSVDVAFARASKRLVDEGASADRIEARGLEFQRRVAAGFHRFAELQLFGSRVVLIDAMGSEDEVAALVHGEASRAL